MPYIYKITNQINEKVYIGKTLETIEKRWKQHLYDSKKDTHKNRPIYRAINKYGVENFTIEQIEKCLEKDINDRERFWIESYNSFKDGYNATIGGDGKAYIDRSQVISLYNKGYTCKEIGQIMSIDAGTVSKILKNNNIKVISGQELARLKKSKPVLLIDDTNNFKRSFSCIKDAAKYLKEEGIASGDIKGITVHIRQVCNKKRKSAYGYKWTWI
jgi:group I intron endonuclease